MFSMLTFLFIEFRSETAYLIFLLEIIMLRSAQLLGTMLYTIIVMFIFAFNFIPRSIYINNTNINLSFVFKVGMWSDNVHIVSILVLPGLKKVL